MAKKRYLNREEKREVLTLASFVAFLDDRAEDWAGNKDSDQVKYTKMARSFGQKILDCIINGLAPEEMDKLVGEYNSDGDKVTKGEIDKMEIVTRYKADAVRDFEEMKNLDSVTPVDTNDFLTIVGLGLASCSICELMGREVTACDCRQLFIKYDIQPFDTDPGEGCPYRINRSENYDDGTD